MSYYYEAVFDFNFGKKRKIDKIPGSRYVRRRTEKILKALLRGFGHQLMKKLEKERGKTIYSYTLFPDEDTGIIELCIYFEEKERCESSRKQFADEWEGTKKALWPDQLKKMGITATISETIEAKVQEN